VIDVRFVIAHGLWILAAAIALAAFSFYRWRARAGESPLVATTALRAAVEPLVVLAIAPALLFPTPARFALALCVPLVWWWNRRATGHLIPPTPLNACLLLLLAMTAVSLVATFDVAVSLGKVAGVVLGVVVFWAIARWTVSEPRLAAVTGGFLLAGGVLAVLGLLGTNWFGKFPILAPIIDRLPRAIRGVPGAEEGFQPNAVAGCLVLFIPLQAALLFSRGGTWLLAADARGGRRALLVGAQAALLALTAGTLLLTQSRGAWVGLIAATMAFLAWHSWRTRVLAAGLVTAFAVFAFTLGAPRLVDLAISQSGPEMARNVSGRVELWSRALYGIHDFPFTGMGMNVFRKVMPRLYPTYMATPGFDVAHAHNHLLQAALDLGIPGLIAYLSLWLVTAVLLVRVYRRAAGPVGRVMAGGLGAGLIAHFTFSLTDAIPLGAKVGVLFWVALAIAVSLHQVMAPRPTRRLALATGERRYCSRNSMRRRELKKSPFVEWPAPRTTSRLAFPPRAR
jgi:putative inorganic carbon (HCO3(-)) transporter